MKAIAVLLVVLACVVSANATIRLFITRWDEPYGLDDPNLSCYPTWAYPEGYDCDHFQVTNFPPADYPSGECGEGPALVCPGTCDGPPVGGYLWLQFQNEPAGFKINGLQIAIRECGGSHPAACVYPTYYVLDNTANGGYRRWDGTATPPYFLEFHANPWTGIAVTARGIQNKAADEPCNLFRGGTQRIALVGAVVCNSAGDHPKNLLAVITNINAPASVCSAGFSLFDRGDVNCDGTIDFGDINPFVLILTDPAAWQETYPDCPFLTGDINGDGAVDFADINPFVALLSGR